MQILLLLCAHYNAMRHFIWAGLLTKELGSELAKIFLDAHEANPSQPADEKAMDLANNRAGILGAEKLIKQNTYTMDGLIELGKEELKNKNLSVLTPQALTEGGK